MLLHQAWQFPQDQTGWTAENVEKESSTSQEVSVLNSFLHSIHQYINFSFWFFLLYHQLAVEHLSNHITRAFRIPNSIYPNLGSDPFERSMSRSLSRTPSRNHATNLWTQSIMWIARRALTLTSTRQSRGVGQWEGWGLFLRWLWVRLQHRKSPKRAPQPSIFWTLQESWLQEPRK